MSVVNPHCLSSRGVFAIKPGRDDLDEFLTGLGNPYHPVTNSEGYLVLLVAENKLNLEQLRTKVQEVISSNPTPDTVFGYGDLKGDVRFREAVSGMMEESFVNAPVDKDCIVAQSGCGAIIDTIAWCVAESGDACIVPGPLYPAFANDFQARARVHLHVADTEHPTYDITESILQKAFDECVAQGRPPKILLLCSPCNPTGAIYSEETLRMCLRWANERRLHIISDEIYGNSIFPGEKFTSIAKICRDLSPNTEKYLGDRVHVAYGFSKDFGSSGLRIGILFSHNASLLTAATNAAYFQGVSRLDQWALSLVLEDRAFLTSYLTSARQNLHACYLGLHDALAAVGVPLTPGRGTLMAWADFRCHLREPTWEAERELWQDLFRRSRVLFTTGKSCGSRAPGFFRVCFAWPSALPNDPTVAMRELRRRLVLHFAAPAPNGSLDKQASVADLGGGDGGLVECGSGLCNGGSPPKRLRID